MADESNPVSLSWGRFLRFRVRGLIVLVLVIGVWLGWIVRSAQIERDAVAAVVKAGGGVHYDWAWSNGKSLPGGKPWAPRWLTDLIGVEYFSKITAVLLDQAWTPLSSRHSGHRRRSE
jgi:hypothetical protein